MQPYPKKLSHICIFVLVFGCLIPNAYALFEDNEARIAILEIRNQRKSDLKKIRSLQENLLALEGRLAQSQQEIGELRGQNENLVRDLELLHQDLKAQQEAQKIQFQAWKDAWQKQHNPIATNYDGFEVSLPQKEKSLYDAALLAYREKRHEQSLRLLASYETLYPLSPLIPSIGFWQGNVLFALGRYQGAIAAYRKALSRDPKQLRAPDSMLGIADAQILLKDSKGAKATLEQLLEQYPDQNASITAIIRLRRLSNQSPTQEADNSTNGNAQSSTSTTSASNTSGAGEGKKTTVRPKKTSTPPTKKSNKPEKSS